VIELSNRTIDEYGNVIFDVADLFPLIVKGYDVTKFLVNDSPEVEQFRATCKLLDNEDLSLQTYTRPEGSIQDHLDKFRNRWFMPDRYRTLSLRVWLNGKCKTQEERQRVDEELKVFEKYELEMMLKSLIYLVDIFVEHKIVWGVGRGSSVSSYVLYLIGIHRVNSLKYELDFSEFLN